MLVGCQRMKAGRTLSVNEQSKKRQERKRKVGSWAEKARLAAAGPHHATTEHPLPIVLMLCRL